MNKLDNFFDFLDSALDWSELHKKSELRRAVYTFQRAQETFLEALAEIKEVAEEHGTTVDALLASFGRYDESDDNDEAEKVA